MAAPVSPTAGAYIDKPFWDAEVYARWVDLYAAWTSYTPTWTCADAAPSLGNGTLDGAYKANGKTVHVRIRWVAGSTTNFGGGLWSFALPSGYAPAAVQSIGGFVTNSAGTSRYAIAAYLTSGSGVFRIAAADGTSGVRSVFGATPASPLTWATGDQLVLTGTYEAS